MFQFWEEVDLDQLNGMLAKPSNEGAGKPIANLYLREKISYSSVSSDAFERILVDSIILVLCPALWLVVNQIEEILHLI